MQNLKVRYMWPTPRVIWSPALGVNVQVFATLWLGLTSEAKRGKARLTWFLLRYGDLQELEF